MNIWDVILTVVIVAMTAGFAVSMTHMRKKQHELKERLLMGSMDRLFTSGQGD